KPEEWPDKAAGLYLQTVRDAAQAAGVPDHLAGWEEWMNANPAAKRREGERLLFGPAAGRQSAADPLDAARRDYQRHNTYLHDLQRAWRDADEAQVFFAGFAPALEGEPPGRVELWKKAAATARDLEKLLGAPPAEAGPTPEGVHRDAEEMATSLREALT